MGVGAASGVLATMALTTTCVCARIASGAIAHVPENPYKGSKRQPANSLRHASVKRAYASANTQARDHR